VAEKRQLHHNLGTREQEAIIWHVTFTHLRSTFLKGQKDDHARAASLASKEFERKATDPALVQYPEGATHTPPGQSTASPKLHSSAPRPG